MRTVAVIRAKLDAEIRRHRAAHKRLLRELSEARGVRYAPARLKAIKADFEAGMHWRDARAKHGLSKGQFYGLAERRGWKRPWPNLKTLKPEEFTRYRKFRRINGLARADAIAEALQ